VGLDLAVEAGEVYALAGRNGSGKSTAVAVLAGLLPPEAGEVLLEGRPIGRGGRARLGVGLQEAACYRHLTVRENLVFFCRLYGVGRREAARLADEAMGRLGLADHAGVRAGSLSGGWRRRLHVAAAVVHRPRAVILDEPDAGLDPQGRMVLAELLASLAAEGVAVLVALHDLELAERAATRVGILHRGRLAAEGRVEELLASTGARAVAEVRTSDPAALDRRATELGWPLRLRGREAALYLARPLELVEVARALEGIPVRSLSLRPVRLEDVYREVTGAVAAGVPDAA